MHKNILKRPLNRRKYIRYPAEISMEYRIPSESMVKTDYTKNISFEGLCFQAQSCIEPATFFTLKFPTISSKIILLGKTVWCAEKSDSVEVGVEFLDENDAYRVKIIEEICYIKNIN